MKRFYKTTGFSATTGGFLVELDGRPVKTPARNALELPTADLAKAICDEWAGQKDEIDSTQMPLTGLAQGALDQVARERDRIAARVAGFADSDMLYFRGDDNQRALVDWQAQQWDPLLDWARQRYDISFVLIHGIMHQSQPDNTLQRLEDAVHAQDDFALAAMLALTGLTGTLVGVLALIENSVAVDDLWSLANLEELWQEQQWGQDEVAAQKREKKRAEYLDAVRFLELSRT
ncbi:Chaperone required for the assembly of the F1-ATPase [Parasphingorhabdus marina DSM 22363]|uniref:Chaperone required for the assembly of the F1-ATPase n=1 Tax=Parasphingorhabdus marina DSM 22363 TaxID=1123272 RepID=A0A1N6CYJ8_9SPHN|nr:ATP12 family protein [Parasphingorhabdus marina]SIN63595.1 Chaperone required for the assembly of the F1-ATPase [Parasphingorhabdus marina DSM 22363]